MTDFSNWDQQNHSPFMKDSPDKKVMTPVICSCLYTNQ